MKNFYARRSLRIFPLYYGVLTLWFLVLPVVNRGSTYGSGRRPAEEVWMWLYAVNWGIVFHDYGFGVMHHFWSLAIEEHFYLIWPLVIWFSRRKTAIKYLRRLLLCRGMSRELLVTLGVSPSGIWHLDTSHVDSLCLGGWLGIDRSWPFRFRASGQTGEEDRRPRRFGLDLRYPLAKGHGSDGFYVSGPRYTSLGRVLGAGLVLVIHAPLSSPLD